MLNRSIIVGRLTKDPELRYTGSGVAVAGLTLAVNRPFKNQNGDSEADFINCVAWRKQAESVANFLKKGSLAGVDGRLQTRSYENQHGGRVFITELVAESVQFLDTKGSKQNQGQNQRQQQENRFQDDPFANNGKPIDITDSDLPF
ncbi:single-stranded DNA-binding protein [Bacillus changyiensis]|uniref:single-stranded DNA-binding protein n=1 Tax=Bacillus changyiensis TaxID=3004103 RepID=UPI0022E1342D|nr:single-stranded DNA-binding protein [Bacillus changyiensis]MDA1478297.1 single-stranded DNA-binding protein [Bacillus changyiensis]